MKIMGIPATPLTTSRGPRPPTFIIASAETDIRIAQNRRELLEGADDILKQMKERGGQNSSVPQPQAVQGQGPQAQAFQSAILSDASDELYQRAFLFDDLDKAIVTSKSVGSAFSGRNRLYKRGDGRFVLVIHNDGTQKDEFSRVCNMLSEYASKLKITPSSEAYFDEHYDVIIKDDAHKKLAMI